MIERPVSSFALDISSVFRLVLYKKFFLLCPPIHAGFNLHVNTVYSLVKPRACFQSMPAFFFSLLTQLLLAVLN